MPYIFYIIYSGKLFKKLFGTLDMEEHLFFYEFFSEFRMRILRTVGNKNRVFVSSSDAKERIKALKDSKEIEDINTRVPLITSEDIEDFQSVINKIPMDLWKRYSNRLRQKAYKRKNQWSRQIEFSEDAYTEFKILKDSLNAKTWNDLVFRLDSDYKKISQILHELDVNNLDDAISQIKELQLLKDK